MIKTENPLVFQFLIKAKHGLILCSSEGSEGGKGGGGEGGVEPYRGVCKHHTAYHQNQQDLHTKLLIILELI